jgi:tetratricopeptide (TPR) repeat protein
VGQSLNSLGSLAYAQNKYPEAHGLCLRSLKILEKADTGSENAAHVLNNLAVIETAMGRYQEALERCRRADAILDGLFAPGHPAHIAPLTNMANIYAHTGRAAEGLPLIDRAVELATLFFGGDHPSTAAVLATRAVVLRAAGKKREAKQTERTAWAILNTHPGIRGMRQRVDVGDLTGPTRAVMPRSERWTSGVDVQPGIERTPSSMKVREPLP